MIVYGVWVLLYPSTAAHYRAFAQDDSDYDGFPPSLRTTESWGDGVEEWVA